MDASSRARAVSALVEHAKNTFEKRIEENVSLVAPISPSPPDLIETIFNALTLDSRDVVLDLGCGDGRWLIAAARRGCSTRGMDLNGDLLEKGRREAARAGVSSLVHLEHGDIFDAALEGSTVIIVYLFREGIARIKSKLEAEAEPGAWIVSVGFRIKGWSTKSTYVVGGLHAFLYKAPDRDT